jgi:hypothetical protein
MTRYLKPAEVAERLEISERAVLELIADDVLAVDEEHGAGLVPEHRVDEFLNYLTKMSEAGRGECVYFVKAKTMGLIKIGKAIDVDVRLRSLQIGSPDILEIIGVIPSVLFSESDVHQKFRAARLHGEWFHPVPELLSFIEECSLKLMDEEAA